MIIQMRLQKVIFADAEAGDRGQESVKTNGYAFDLLLNYS